MLIFRPDVVLHRLGINDVSAILLARSLASSISAWGIAYLFVLVDPARYRPFGWLGVYSKTFFFTVYLFAFLSQRISSAAFIPALIDLALALLFLEYLLRTRSRPGISQN